MERCFRYVISACRALLRGLSTERRRVSNLEKLLRGALLVPVFGTMLVLLRLRCWLHEPLLVKATTPFGARLDCRLPDFIQTYLYLFGVWEPDVTDFIDRRLQPGDTFVDVGANIGYHTLLAAKAVENRAKVVAIESSPKIFALLQKSLADNGNPTNVRTVNRAVGETIGVVPLYEGPAKNIGLSTTVETRGFPREGEIAVAPLADLLQPQELSNARLVKIDVEGAEAAVLRGMKSFLEGCPPDVEILIEVSPLWWKEGAKSPQEVLQPWLDAGFHVYQIDNDLWPWRYLWSRDVRPPRRVRTPLTKRVKRLDLVLSRADSDHL